jgi:hypothetical protein
MQIFDDNQFRALIGEYYLRKVYERLRTCGNDGKVNHL